MKKLIVAAIAAALLAGCAELTDPAVIRVIEYGGGAGGLINKGEVGGCSVYQAESKPSAEGKASVSVVLAYQGERCAVRAVSK